MAVWIRLMVLGFILCACAMTISCGEKDRTPAAESTLFHEDERLEAYEVGIEKQLGVEIGPTAPDGLPAGLDSLPGADLILVIANPGPPEAFLLHYDLHGMGDSTLTTLDVSLKKLGLLPVGTTHDFGRAGTLYVSPSLSIIVSLGAEPELEVFVVRDQLTP